jgi:hypothetical protein
MGWQGLSGAKQHCSRGSELGWVLLGEGAGIGRNVQWEIEVGEVKAFGGTRVGTSEWIQSERTYLEFFWINIWRCFFYGQWLLYFLCTTYPTCLSLRTALS